MTQDTTSGFAGRFVWRELTTPDPEAAVGFYGELFGWTHTTQNMGDFDYIMFAKGDPKDGNMVAGLVKASPGEATGWQRYVTVDDVDAALEVAKRHAGTVVEPAMDIPGVGRFGVIADPSGAHIAPFKSLTPGASGDPAPEDFGFCWCQLMTDAPLSGPGSVNAFYEAVFGWTAAPMPNGDTVFMRGDKMTASTTTLPQMARDAGATSHWLDYVLVPDVGEALARANRLGARTLVDVTEVPNMGIFAIFADPAGSVLAFWKQTGQA